MSTDKAYKRRTTRRGLGAPASGEHASDPALDGARCPPASDRPRMTLPAPSSPEPYAMVSYPPGGGKLSKPPERGSRNPISVDDVGDTAVELTSRRSPSARPKLVKNRELSSAPLEPREAFLLSLVDGKMDEASLVDVSGMTEDEVAQILARLRRLGLIAHA